MHRSQRILVTGGAGFIGSHLCERLLADGHRVVVLDNFLTGMASNLPSNEPRLDVVERDVTEPLDVGDVDQIFNLACPASPVHYQADPIRTAKTSVFGVLNVVELAKRCGARVLQASTSEVYGDPEVHPQHEDYVGHVNPIGPRACYDESKRLAETLCFDFRRKEDVDIRVVRIFNTYGPRMQKNDGRVVSNFVVQALSGEPLTVFGAGSQTRSLCYVSDMVEGLALAMQSTFCGPTNLGNPEELCVGDLARLVLKMTGSLSDIVHQPLPEDDPKRRRPDIGRALEKLGWKPTTPVEEGLKKTIEYFKALV